MAEKEGYVSRRDDIREALKQLEAEIRHRLCPKCKAWLRLRDIGCGFRWICPKCSWIRGTVHGDDEDLP